MLGQLANAAILADIAYADYNKGNFEQILSSYLKSQELIKKLAGVYRITTTCKSLDGFQATLLKNENNGYVLIIKGTDGFFDILNDLQFASGEIPCQVNSLIDFCDEELLNIIGTKQIKVIGHSLGGVLAQFFALAYPHNVRHIITFNSPGVFDDGISSFLSGILGRYINNLNTFSNKTMNSIENALRQGTPEYYYKHIRVKTFSDNDTNAFIAPIQGFKSVFDSDDYLVNTKELFKSHSISNTANILNFCRFLQINARVSFNDSTIDVFQKHIGDYYEKILDDIVQEKDLKKHLDNIYKDIRYSEFLI